MPNTRSVNRAHNQYSNVLMLKPSGKLSTGPVTKDSGLVDITELLPTTLEHFRSSETYKLSLKQRIFPNTPG